MNEVIYPVPRLLANPKVFFAIASILRGPDAETLKDIFYEMLEAEITDLPEEDVEFQASEVCFRESPETPGVIQIIFDTGSAAELRPDGGFIAGVANENDISVAASIYNRIVRAIEESQPQFAGDIALCEPPVPSNQFLRSDDGEYFQGEFHLLSDPETVYGFTVEILDIPNDILKARITPN